LMSLTGILTGSGRRRTTSGRGSICKRIPVRRVIGPIRRECLDHVMVFDERVAADSCFLLHSYRRSRTHLSLGKDSPASRPIQRREIGPIVAKREVGGLHHTTNARQCEILGCFRGMARRSVPVGRGSAPASTPIRQLDPLQSCLAAFWPWYFTPLTASSSSAICPAHPP
jgi:hypothetical protein